MPKRSNQFQQVVTYLVEQLAPLGARVMESAEVEEIGLQRTPREVDTLLEMHVGPVQIRVAVESRDRGRKGDVQWIDELIGKYKNLPIDRVVAISNAGFSKVAKEKAALERIELLSPSEVEATDWPSAFKKLGAALFDAELEMVDLEFLGTPPIEKISLQDRVRAVDDNGDAREAPMSQVIEEIRALAIPDAEAYFRKNRSQVYKTLADIEKPVSIRNTIKMRGITLVTSAGSHEISKVDYHILVRGRRTVIPVVHRVIKGVGLLTTVHLEDG